MIKLTDVENKENFEFKDNEVWDWSDKDGYLLEQFPIDKLKDSKFLFVNGDKYEIISFEKWEMGYEIEIKRCD